MEGKASFVGGTARAKPWGPERTSCVQKAVSPQHGYKAGGGEREEEKQRGEWGPLGSLGKPQASAELLSCELQTEQQSSQRERERVQMPGAVGGLHIHLPLTDRWVLSVGRQASLPFTQLLFSSFPPERNKLLGKDKGRYQKTMASPSYFPYFTAAKK